MTFVWGMTEKYNFNRDDNKEKLTKGITFRGQDFYDCIIIDRRYFLENVDRLVEAAKDPQYRDYDPDEKFNILMKINGAKEDVIKRGPSINIGDTIEMI